MSEAKEINLAEFLELLNKGSSRYNSILNSFTIMMNNSTSPYTAYTIYISKDNKLFSFYHPEGKRTWAK